MDMSGEVVQPMNFSDTNPGRPDGPTMTVEPGELVYLLAVPLETKNNEEIKEPCSVGGNALAPTEEHPYLFGKELDCALNLTGENASTTTPEIPEKQVEAAVTLLTRETPWYTLTFRYADKIANDQCNIYVSASGLIKRGPEYSHAGCQAADVTVSR